MTWGRFRVEFPDDSGAIDLAVVWAADEGDAIKKAREWIEWAQTDDPREGPNGPFGGKPRVRRIGEEPLPNDIGVAAHSEGRNYRFVSSDGIHLTVRVDPNPLIVNTTSFREDEIWEPVRRSLANWGGEPMSGVVITSMLDDRGPGTHPYLLVLVEPEGRCLLWCTEAPRPLETHAWVGGWRVLQNQDLPGRRELQAAKELMHQSVV